MPFPLKSYLLFKQQTQRAIDFVVLGVYAVPTLRAQVKRGKKLPKPDDFPHDRSTAAVLVKHAADYRNNLSTYLWLSAFSFFEAFARGAIDEMLDFHGGPDGFLKLAYKKGRSSLGTTSTSMAEHKRELQKWQKARNRERYRNHLRPLEATAYRFPTELFAAYGVSTLIQFLKEKRFKASIIPDIYERAFLFALSPRQIARFEEIRRTRNDIAHGKSIALKLKDVIKAIDDLRDLALAINNHLSEHFFVIEELR